jgi:TPR repeat protein
MRAGATPETTMRIDRIARPLMIAVALATSAAVAPVPAEAQVMFFDSGQPIKLEEEIARYLPGVSNFQKGLDAYKKGQGAAAIEAWLTSASWAMKDAQYNLGLAYFKGSGVAADRPRGLAWLALAAERKNPAMQASLATAWDSATDAEHQQANALWRELKKQYGDDVALPKAKKRFETELAQMSGARTGSGGARVVSRTMGAMDSKAYREKLEALAAQNFGDGSTNGSGESGDAAAGKDAG